MQFTFRDVFHWKQRSDAAERKQLILERERQNHGTFGLLGIWFGLRLPDELAQLIHLSKRHLPEQTDRKDADKHM